MRPTSECGPVLSPMYVSSCSLECSNHQHCYYTRKKRANDDVQKTASTQTDPEQPPETTQWDSNAGQGHAGASVGQGQAGTSFGQGHAGASFGQGHAGASVGQGHAGASAGQVGGGGSNLTEAEVERIVRKHAALSWTACYERGCLFHKGAKEGAMYWPEDHPRPQKKSKKQTKKPNQVQEHQGQGVVW